ncbi:hypothetical protein B566_EDAN004766, partial [Ephemera danica]
RGPAAAAAALGSNRWRGREGAEQSKVEGRDNTERVEEFCKKTQSLLAPSCSAYSTSDSEQTMDDEADPWGDSEETPAEAPPAAAAEGGDAPALEGGEGAPAEGAPAGDAPVEEAAPPPPRPRDPNKPIYFKYFNRKTHLNYNYLYDYRHSYYDDVIKYLDARQRHGSSRVDIPKPQTWAERALRTYPERIRTTQEVHKDSELLSRIRNSNQAYYYHSREYVNRRHSGLY